MKRLSTPFLLVTLVLFFNANAGWTQDSGWKHISIDPIMPGSSWGTGGPALADYDRDGDLDVAVSRRNTKQAYWYEQLNDSIWIQHLMGGWPTLELTLGTTSIDMDNDGWMDVMYEGVWFRNPGCLKDYPDVEWEARPIKAGGHDAAAVDVNGDNRTDLLVYDGHKLAWYDPANLLREHVISAGHEDHGGMAPHGYGDLDGDGDIDVLIAGFWFANPGEGKGGWVKHSWPFDPVPNASYGISIRSWVVDLDGDGDQDIVYAHCDTGGSKLFWVKNEGAGMYWRVFCFPDPPTRPGDREGSGSFHSLAIADFNGDNRLDIFVGEQEDPDTYMEAGGKVAMKPRGLKERGVIWYSMAPRDNDFRPCVIQIDNPGWHDAQAGDVDGDGDPDLVSKIWHADGPVYHLDYWQNQLISAED